MGLTPRSSKAGWVMALDGGRYGGPGSHMWDNYVEIDGDLRACHG